MEEQTYFVRVKDMQFYNTVFEDDNLTKDEAFDVVRKYLSNSYHVKLWDNLIEDWISPEQFLEDNL